MENTGDLKNYIHSKLVELEKEKDMQDTVLKGRLSFGVDAATYGRLPAWPDLIRKKKQLVRWVWINAFLSSLLLIGLVSDLPGQLGVNWLVTVGKWVMLA